MTISIPPKELNRLSNLLGMIGSDHDGEALNAARLADMLVKKSNVTWQEVLSSQASEGNPEHNCHLPQPAKWRHDNHRMRIKFLLSNQRLMCAGEIEFCERLRKTDSISASEDDQLDQLVREVVERA